MATKKNTKFTDHSGNKWVISAKPRKKKSVKTKMSLEEFLGIRR